MSEKHGLAALKINDKRQQIWKKASANAHVEFLSLESFRGPHPHIIIFIFKLGVFWSHCAALSGAEDSVDTWPCVVQLVAFEMTVTHGRVYGRAPWLTLANVIKKIKSTYMWLNKYSVWICWFKQTDPTFLFTGDDVQKKSTGAWNKEEYCRLHANDRRSLQSRGTAAVFGLWWHNQIEH